MSRNSESRSVHCSTRGLLEAGAEVRLRRVAGDVRERPALRIAAEVERLATPLLRPVRREHGLAPPRWCAQDADVIPEHSAGRSELRLAELAAKFELERLAIDAFVADIELDAELFNQTSDVG